MPLSAYTPEYVTAKVAVVDSQCSKRQSCTTEVGTEGTQFSLSQLNYNMIPTGPAWASELVFAGNYADPVEEYSVHRIGVLFGDDHLLNTADDIVINSGAGTQLVDAIFGRGIGNAWDPKTLEALELKKQLTDYTITTQYEFKTASGDFSGSGSVYVVPGPGGAVLTALAGIFASRKRRR